MLRSFSTAFLLISFTFCSTALQAAEPEDTVTHFHATLTESMNRGAKLGCEGRIKLMQPATDEAYNLPFIAERALRRRWKELDDSQRAAFTAAMRTSVITTYATEFSRPGDVVLATGTTEKLPNGDALVHSTLTPSDSKTAITLDYVLRPVDGRWRIVNVLADGVSDLALRATQYEGIVKTDGFPALLAKLEQQTQELRARCN